MLSTQVVIIGGGATGMGILRDLSIRGVKAILVERGDLGSGTSSRFHGLLHSGARYAVRDESAARECIVENRILREIGKSCVEPVNSVFIRTPEDDPAYETTWVNACRRAGICVKKLDVADLLREEPNLSPDIQAAYLCPGAAIDGFRLLWQLADSARRYGGQIMTYTTVTGLDIHNGRVMGVKATERYSGEEIYIACEYVINAAGPWCARVAALAGLTLNVRPSKGSLIVFNHRLAANVIHRLHKPSDADIFVPHGTVTILGTTSMDTDPDDTSTTQAEISAMLRVGRATFPKLDEARILRVFAGCRPLYVGESGEGGREASRDFAAIDHEKEHGLAGFMSVCGGKFTTHRLMAEKVCDLVAPLFGCTQPCATATIPLVDPVSAELTERARRVFPACGVRLAANRQGPSRMQQIVERIEQDPEQGEIICECENITRAEIEEVGSESTTHSVSDVRRRTRLGMGTCQGTFCTYRAVGTVQALHRNWTLDTEALFREFLEARFKGIRPVLWGNQFRDVELTRGIYEVSLNINHQAGPRVIKSVLSAVDKKEGGRSGKK